MKYVIAAFVIAVAVVLSAPHLKPLMHEQFVKPADAPAWYKPEKPATWKSPFPG